MAGRDGLLWRRPVERAVRAADEQGYRRTLGAFDLTSIGIAAIIGAGIFVVLGAEARDVAGPAVVVSIAIGGVAAVLAALTFAEFAGIVPTSGGMYEYAFAALGRLPGFLMGWSVILAYMVGNMAVAAGWSAFFTSVLGDAATGWEDYHTIPGSGGVFDVPAAAVMLVVVFLCLPRVRESASVNNLLVVFKVGVAMFVVGFGLFLIEPSNWRPFSPGGTEGIMASAASLLFAYLGFDTVAAAGAEARRPRRDLPIGTMASVGIAAALYIGMGLVVTGMRPIASLTGEVPLADGFRAEGHAWAAILISAGALVAMTTVMYAFHLALARVVQTMGADGFLPGWFGSISPRTGTPWFATLSLGAITVVGAGVFELGVAVDATVAATGTMYIAVAVGVLVLKATRPDLERPFSTPAWVAFAAVVVLTAIIALGLEPILILAYVAWLGAGLMVYGFYSHRRNVALEARRDEEREAAAGPPPSPPAPGEVVAEVAPPMERTSSAGTGKAKATTKSGSKIATGRPASKGRTSERAKRT